MKIAFICRIYNKQGGISRYVAELVEAFSQEHEVHVFTNSWEDVSSDKIIFHKVPMIKGNFFLRRKKQGLATILQVYSFALMSKFKIDTSGFDIVHSEGDCFIPFDVYTAGSCHKAAVKKARKREKRIINFLKNTRLNPLNLIVLAIEKFTYNPKNYKKIIAVSNVTKHEIIREYGVSDEDIIVIPNGINIDEFKIESRSLFRNKVRDKHKILENEIIILFVAHEFKRKGLRYLIEALNLINNDKVKIMVVGRDDEKAFVELAKKLGIKEKVIFAGHSTNIAEYFAAADIFCFPTLDEPFGLVIIEALASGLPTITSKIAGAAELMQNGKDGLLLDDPTSPNEIATKINLLINDKNLYEQISKEAINTAKKYSWQQIAKRTLEVYKKVK
jgi:UDP-glucose:(heptosyl)LPS alpha-1,3-glucosyltransferase